MATLPAEVSYFTLTGKLTKAAADGADADLYPDGIPLVGQVTVKPEIGKRDYNGKLRGGGRVAVASTPPVLMVVDPVPFVLLGDGTFSVSLVNSHNDALSPSGWAYTVDFALEGATIPSFSFDPPPAGTLTVDLTSVAPPDPGANITIVKGDPGDPGDPGPVNTLTIGTVTTGAPGSAASATITGAAPSQTLALTIPQGEPGQSGTGTGDVVHTRKVTAGTGLTGGGDLSADRTLAVDMTALSATFGPLPSGTPTVGQVPVVSTASPLALGWGAGGGGGGVGVVLASAHGFLPGATAAANETAWTATLAAADAANLPIYIGPGTYQKTTGLDLRASATRAGMRIVAGAGPGATTIVVTTDTAELLQVGGFLNVITDFTIKHASDTPGATTGDGLSFYKAAYSTFARLQIYNTGRAISISPTVVNEPGTGAGTGNYMFSNTFTDIGVNRFSKNGLYLYGTGSTQSVWTNIYVQNLSIGGTPLPSNGSAVGVEGAVDAVFNGLNVEDYLSTTGYAMSFNAGCNVVINGLHLERVNMPAGSHQIDLYGEASVTFSQPTIAYSDVAVSGSGGASHHFRVTAGARLYVDNLYLNHNLKTNATTYTIVEIGDTNADNVVEFGYYSTNVTAAISSVTNSTANTGLKRVGNTSYLTSAAGGAVVTAYAILDGRDVTGGVTVTTNVASYTTVAVPLAHVVKNVGMDVSVANALKCVTAGAYQINATVLFGAGAAGPPAVAVSVNGQAASLQFGSAGAGTARVSGGGLVSLAVGDLVTVTVYSTAATTLSAGQYNQSDIQLSAARIGA